MAARPTMFSIVCEDTISKSASLAVVVIASNARPRTQAQDQVAHFPMLEDSWHETEIPLPSGSEKRTRSGRRRRKRRAARREKSPAMSPNRPTATIARPTSSNLWRQQRFALVREHTSPPYSGKRRFCTLGGSPFPDFHSVMSGLVLTGCSGCITQAAIHFST